MEANRKGDLLQDYVCVEEDGGMFCDLCPRDGIEPTIVLVTFLGEWDRSNMSGGNFYGTQTGDERQLQFRVVGKGDTWGVAKQ